MIGLLKADHEVHHFSLMASKTEILRRLKKRGDSDAWNARQVDRCLDGLKNPVFEEHIDTEKMGLYEVVEYIGQRVGAEMAPDRRSTISKALYRLNVTVRHIRW